MASCSFANVSTQDAARWIALHLEQVAVEEGSATDATAQAGLVDAGVGIGRDVHVEDGAAARHEFAETGRRALAVGHPLLHPYHVESLHEVDGGLFPFQVLALGVA